MSRSMHFFRKYSGPILAVSGVILTVIWVVGPFLGDLTMSPHTAQSGEAVVSWEGGTLQENDLHHMRAEHGAAVQFLARIIEITRENGGTPQAATLQIDQQGRIISPGIPLENSDEALVRTMLLAEKARRIGVRVDRDSVFEFLKRLSAYTMAEGDWLEVAHEVLPRGGQGGPSMTVNQLFDRLEVELLAQNMRIMEQAALFAVPPGEIWDYFLRLNRRAKIEAVPIDVEQFVSQVGDPKPADEPELRAIFEQGKNREPNPALAEPGFHVPMRAAFGYFTIDRAPYLENAKKEITEEQIKKQYEDDLEKGLHKVLDLPSEEDASKPKPPAGDDKDTPAKDAPEKDAPEKDGEKPADKADAKPADKADAKPADSDKPADKPADEKNGDQPAGTTKSNDDEKSDDKPADEEKNVRQAPPSTTVFVSTENEEPADPKPTDPPSEEKKSDDKPADESKTEKPASDQAPAGDKKDGKAQDGKESGGDDTVEKPADVAKPDAAKSDAAQADAPKEEKEPKFKPLAEVHDEIRDRLAQPIAQDALRETIQALMKAVDEYGNEYRRWLVRKENNGKAGEEPKFNPEALAKQYPGVTYHSTKLVDRYEVGEYDIGQNAQDFDRQRFTMVDFADVAFSPEALLYFPQQLFSRSTERELTYLYWRTKEEPARDVTFDEVRKQVVAAWKKNKAYQIARKEAEQLADKAKNAASLKEVADPTKVIEPPPFSWLSTGGIAVGMAEPTLSTVQNITYAGREFMSGVFELEPGETGVAPDQPHDTVYVVRVASTEPKEEELRARFIDTGFNMETLTVANRERMRVMMELDDDLKQQFGVHWLRPPQAGSQMR